MAKYKLKWQKSKGVWLLHGPNVKETNLSYHQALDTGTKLARKAKGVLEVYSEAGDLKEKREFAGA